MKRLRTLMTLCLVAMTLGVAMTSCEKENVDAAADGSTIEAPLPGSITIKMRNYDNGWTRIWFATSTHLYINSANNFRSGNDYANRYYIDIASVGKVSGLGGITVVPETGWTDEVSVFVGHGYVVRFAERIWDSDLDEYVYSDYTYTRIFVHDEIISTGGGIIGYTVSYIEGM